MGNLQGRWVLVLVPALTALALTGCDNRWNRTHPKDNDGIAGNSPTSTSATGDGGAAGTFTSSGGSGASPVCPGACKSSPSAPFEDRLIMVSMGAPSEVQACPDWAHITGFVGYALQEDVAPTTCPACTCSPAACAMPEAMHASAAKCDDAGQATSTPTNAPPGWEGTCTDDNPIAAGLTCGQGPCVASITIESPLVRPCLPSAQGPPASFPDPSWIVARECLIGPPDADGCELGQLCAPLPPPGFMLCQFFRGEDPGYECPPGHEGPFVFHDTRSDTRGCTPCQCGEPQGADCSAVVSLFSDGACSDFLASYTLTTAMDGGCVDLPPGAALGSKLGLLAVDKLGSCAPSGGEPSGAVELSGPLTLCCEPASDPPAAPHGEKK